MKHSMHRHRRTLFATLIPTLMHGVAVAQETQLEDIVVTAPSALEVQPLNATDRDKVELQSMTSATSDAASLLKGIPGVSFYGAGGVSSLPVIHGMADDRLRIKVDGMDLISACGNHMNSPLSYIDPSNVERVQVFAGIAPVSSGGDSIGGTVIVESAAPEFARPGEGVLKSGEIGTFYRSNGNAFGGNVAAGIANESVSIRYSGSSAQSDNYTSAEAFKAAGLAAPDRGWLDGDEVGSSAYKSINHSLGIAFRLDPNHLLDLELGLQDIPYQGYPNQRMDMTGNDSTQVSLRYEGQFDWGKFEGRAYNEHTRHKMDFADDKQYWYPNGIPGPISGGAAGIAAGMPMDTDGRNTGLTVKADLELSERDILRVGGEMQHYRLDDWWDPSGRGMWPNTFWNIRDGERDRYAVFAEWDARWSAQWFSQLGVRHETVKMDTGDVTGYNPASVAVEAEAIAFNALDHSKTDNNWDMTALTRATPSASQTFEFGYARKTRSPNLYERYTWSTWGMAMRMVNMAGDGNGYVGNLNLEPEVAHTLSFTADWHDHVDAAWGLVITPYYSYVENYIDAALCTTANCVASNAVPGFRYLTFVNQDARLFGIDVSGHLPLGQMDGVGVFTGRGTVSYVDGENLTTGDNLYNIMPLNATLAVEHRIGSWSNTIEGQFVSAKDDVSAVRNELKTAGYGLLNLRSSYTWKNVRFDIGLENALDKQYSQPLGGAYTGQGATMSGTGVPYGVAVPGMGRSLFAGVNVTY